MLLFPEGEEGPRAGVLDHVPSPIPEGADHQIEAAGRQGRVRARRAGGGRAGGGVGTITTPVPPPSTYCGGVTAMPGMVGTPAWPLDLWVADIERDGNTLS